jgi:hypothetical protein
LLLEETNANDLPKVKSQSFFEAVLLGKITGIEFAIVGSFLCDSLWLSLFDA